MNDRVSRPLLTTKTNLESEHIVFLLQATLKVKEGGAMVK